MKEIIKYKIKWVIIFSIVLISYKIIESNWSLIPLAILVWIFIDLIDSKFEK